MREWITNIPNALIAQLSNSRFIVTMRIIHVPTDQRTQSKSSPSSFRLTLLLFWKKRSQRKFRRRKEHLSQINKKPNIAPQIKTVKKMFVVKLTKTSVRLRAARKLIFLFGQMG